MLKRRIEGGGPIPCPSSDGNKTKLRLRMINYISRTFEGVPGGRTHVCRGMATGRHTVGLSTGQGGRSGTDPSLRTFRGNPPADTMSVDYQSSEL